MSSSGVRPAIPRADGVEHQPDLVFRDAVNLAEPANATAVKEVFQPDLVQVTIQSAARIEQCDDQRIAQATNNRLHATSDGAAGEMQDLRDAPVRHAVTQGKLNESSIPGGQEASPLEQDLMSLAHGAGGRARGLQIDEPVLQQVHDSSREGLRSGVRLVINGR